MAHDYLLLAGSVAFGCAVGDAEIALSRREGLQDVHFVRSGPCTEFPNLTRYVIEVHSESDPAQAKHWMDHVMQALTGHVGALHRCMG